MHLVRRLSSIELQRPSYLYRGVNREEDETQSSSKKKNEIEKRSSEAGRKSREQTDANRPSTAAQHVSSQFFKRSGINMVIN